MWATPSLDAPSSAMGGALGRDGGTVPRELTWRSTNTSCVAVEAGARGDRGEAGLQRRYASSPPAHGGPYRLPCQTRARSSGEWRSRTAPPGKRPASSDQPLPSIVVQEEPQLTGLRRA
jgi:hypothetical protein